MRMWALLVNEEDESMIDPIILTEGVIIGFTASLLAYTSKVVTFRRFGINA